MIKRLAIFSTFLLVSAHAALAVSIDTEIPASEITPFASSMYSAGQSPIHLIDGSGLNGDTHDNNQYSATMWHTTRKTVVTAVAGTESPAWVQFDFSKPQELKKILIWNHNQLNGTDRGFRQTKILGTADGTTWYVLAKLELPRANGNAAVATEVEVSAKKPLKSVVIVADSNWGADAYGLSEVKFVSTREEADLPFPSDMECVPQPFYRYRADGKPGREISLNFKGEKIFSKARVEVTANSQTEIAEISPVIGGRSVCSVLLPADVGVKQESRVTLTLRQGAKTLKKTITVPALRQWTIYLYNHAHVDIGYTAPQDIVEFIHKRNIVEGIKLADATKDYPAGARYRWNPEVTWPLERLWHTASPEQKEGIQKAIRDGHLCVDASYANLNTSNCSDEELFQVFRFSRKMQKLTGMPIDTFQQMDVPGMSWGLVPVMAQEGVRYIMAWPNGGDRIGHAYIGIKGQPFWWVGPDGKSKVLFFQPGSYANSGSMVKGGALGRPWFGQRDTDKIPAVIKTGSAHVNFMGQLTAAESAGYPYDFIVLSWSLWDNNPIDADVPDAVKAWNEQYAYPHIIIAGGHEIMSAIEQKYGDKLPMVKGDFTEYWTDGLGSAARLTALNRNAKERLTQAETLWTMLRPGKPAPRADFDEAWRYIVLGDEHTWCAENPKEPFFQNAIWKVKQSYFREADERTQTLFDNALAPVTDKSSGAFGPPDGSANGGVAVFNTHSWKHGGLVTLSSEESARGDRVTDEQGKDVPAQRLSTGELVFLASDVPAFSSRHYRVLDGKYTPTDGCKLNGTTLENEQLRVTINPTTGNITHLVNLATGWNFADAKVNGGLNAFRWLPGGVDNAQADTNITVSTAEYGPLVVELRIESKATGCRPVTRSVRLVHGQPWVEISNVVDKLPLVAKDGVHFGFGFDIPNATTRVDIPWGVIRLEDDQWAAGNRNWLTLQRWLDISNDKEGVTWCSLDAPVFESSGMTANVIGSAKGSPAWISRLQSSSIIYSWAMNNHWYTNFPLTQDGPVTFRYRILPHGAYDAATANRFGMEQAQPLAHVTTNNNPALKPLVAIANDRVSVSILKPSVDGKATIVRLRSLSDKPELVKLSFPAGIPKSLHICELTEEPGKAVSDEVTVPAMGQITLRSAW